MYHYGKQSGGSPQISTGTTISPRRCKHSYIHCGITYSNQDMAIVSGTSAKICSPEAEIIGSTKGGDRILNGNFDRALEAEHEPAGACETPGSHNLTDTPRSRGSCLQKPHYVFMLKVWGKLPPSQRLAGQEENWSALRNMDSQCL